MSEKVISLFVCLSALIHHAFMLRCGDSELYYWTNNGEVISRNLVEDVTKYCPFCTSYESKFFSRQPIIFLMSYRVYDAAMHIQIGATSGHTAFEEEEELPSRRNLTCHIIHDMHTYRTYGATDRYVEKQHANYSECKTRCHKSLNKHMETGPTDFGFRVEIQEKEFNECLSCMAKLNVAFKRFTVPITVRRSSALYNLYISNISIAFSDEPMHSQKAHSTCSFFTETIELQRSGRQLKPKFTDAGTCGAVPIADKKSLNQSHFFCWMEHKSINIPRRSDLFEEKGLYPLPKQIEKLFEEARERFNQPKKSVILFKGTELYQPNSLGLSFTLRSSQNDFPKNVSIYLWSHEFFSDFLGYAAKTSTWTYKGAKPLADMTPSGMRVVLDMFDRQFVHEPFDDRQKFHQRERSDERLGCFHWSQNKWYTIIYSQHWNWKGNYTPGASYFEEPFAWSAYLATHSKYSKGKSYWKATNWTILNPIRSSLVVKSFKCAQFNNIIVWSAINMKKEFVVFRANLDQKSGTLADEPKKLSSEILCKCSKSVKKLTSGAIELIYPNLDNPNILELVVLCGKVFCATRLHDVADLQKTDYSRLIAAYPGIHQHVLWFQMDQTNLYYTTNSSLELYAAPHYDFDNKRVFYNYTKRTTTISNFSKAKSIDVYILNTRWFIIFKDLTRLPVPPRECVIPALARNGIQFAMRYTGTMMMNLNLEWPDTCKLFSKPPSTVEIMIFPSHVGKFKSCRLETTCQELKVTFEETNREIVIEKIQDGTWYNITIGISVTHFPESVLKLWYGEIKWPSSATMIPAHFKKNNTGTHNLTLAQRNNTSIILSSSLGLMLFIIGFILIYYFTCRRLNKKWIIPQRLQRISKKDIQLIECIATGHWGLVWKATLLQPSKTSAIVAAKILKFEVTDNDQKNFREEAQILSGIECPNIVNVLGICLQSRPVILAFEFMDGGALDSHFNNSILQRKMLRKHLIMLINDALSACIYLEQEGYVHRDIAARNCLISLDTDQTPKLLKLADFGLAKDVGTDATAHYKSSVQQQVPIQWSAPETMKVPSISDHKSDVWSFGVLVYEIFSWGSIPYGSCKIHQAESIFCPMETNINSDLLVHMICHQEYNLILHPEPCCANFNEVMRRNLFEKCWQVNPDNRPSFKTMKVEMFPVLIKSIHSMNLKYPDHSGEEENIRNAYEETLDAMTPEYTLEMRRMD